jgi:hypothetical protein
MLKFQETMNRIIEEIARDAAAIRARGGEVVFAQMPYDGMYAELEDVVFPKARAFDRLAGSAGAIGVSFQDYPSLQGYYLPEWSHLAPQDAEKFTANFVPILYGRLNEIKAEE